ncbi:hypothetical protein BDV96DRAFT_606867 [Lophiotrema nucula]|uniref:Uncharacterized protein n=1 Tax=Lophiotrema nucula TaxID=690887 RepID=A0A6A5YL40_9PLEO|nr:hypothetical protein BDV96DRAFT_606867 [Lophiotrema nucula]
MDLPTHLSLLSWYIRNHYPLCCWITTTFLSSFLSCRSPHFHPPAHPSIKRPHCIRIAQSRFLQTWGQHQSKKAVDEETSQTPPESLITYTPSFAETEHRKLVLAKRRNIWEARCKQLQEQLEGTYDPTDSVTVAPMSADTKNSKVIGGDDDDPPSSGIGLMVRNYTDSPIQIFPRIFLNLGSLENLIEKGPGATMKSEVSGGYIEFSLVDEMVPPWCYEE